MRYRSTAAVLFLVNHNRYYSMVIVLPERGAETEIIIFYRFLTEKYNCWPKPVKSDIPRSFEKAHKQNDSNLCINVLLHCSRWLDSPGNNIIGQRLSPVNRRRRSRVVVAQNIDQNGFFSHFAFTSRKRLIWTHWTDSDHFLQSAFNASLLRHPQAPIQCKMLMCAPSAGCTTAPSSAPLLLLYLHEMTTKQRNAIRFDKNADGCWWLLTMSKKRTAEKRSMWTLTNQYSWSHNQWTGLK